MSPWHFRFPEMFLLSRVRIPGVFGKRQDALEPKESVRNHYVSLAICTVLLLSFGLQVCLQGSGKHWKRSDFQSTNGASTGGTNSFGLSRRTDPWPKDVNQLRCIHKPSKNPEGFVENWKWMEVSPLGSPGLSRSLLFMAVSSARRVPVPKKNGPFLERGEPPFFLRKTVMYDVWRLLFPVGWIPAICFGKLSDSYVLKYHGLIRFDVSTSWTFSAFPRSRTKWWNGNTFPIDWPWVRYTK